MYNGNTHQNIDLTYEYISETSNKVILDCGLLLDLCKILNTLSSHDIDWIIKKLGKNLNKRKKKNKSFYLVGSLIQNEMSFLL